ncbi:MAG: GNAT family N-acetyltransferase [Chloroflexi bacterium]|nr:GNAT family N-acetyltransferase [Chloroflexota bacterium]|tara:strand:+ start:593 stop:1030 length:438 start_codon:yes stop_codon:yes gene_type:complete
MKIEIIDAKESNKISHCFDIRKKVFVEEQGVPVEEELDPYDDISIHALALVDNKPVATGRLILSNKSFAKIGRMAVLSQFRRTGVGSKVLLFLEKKAVEKNINEISLHAQEYVMKFYKNHDYKERGNIFLEAGIKHIEMFKKLEK